MNHMTVAQLIAELQTLPQDALVSAHVKVAGENYSSLRIVQGVQREAGTTRVELLWGLTPETVERYIYA